MCGSVAVGHGAPSAAALAEQVAAVEGTPVYFEKRWR